MRLFSKESELGLIFNEKEGLLILKWLLRYNNDINDCFNTFYSIDRFHSK